MITPSQFRREFPGDPKDMPPTKGVSEGRDGSGCLAGCLGMAALSAVLLSASFGITRCEEAIEGDKGAPTAPLPPEEGPVQSPEQRGTAAEGTDSR